MFLEDMFNKSEQQNEQIKVLSNKKKSIDPLIRDENTRKISYK